MPPVECKTPVEEQNKTANRRGRATGNRRERTRGQILQATFKLIGTEQGLRVRIEEICALAGVSRGTFYNYFSNLEDLFSALWLDYVQELVRTMSTSIIHENSGIESTSTAIRSILEHARVDRHWGWAMVNLATTNLIFGVGAFAPTVAAVERGITAGEFDVRDVRAGRDIILGACLVGVITMLREDTPATFPETIARLALRGLGASAERLDDILARPIAVPTVR